MNSRALALLGLAPLVFLSCGGGGGGGGSESGFSSGGFSIVEVSNGFGALLPYSIGVPDASGATDPSKAPVAITSPEILLANITSENGVRPPTQWDTSPVLSTQRPGNHMIFVRFNQPIAIDSVLSSTVDPTATDNLLSGIEVFTVNASTGVQASIPGRGFVGGMTYGSVDPADPTRRLLEEWVLQDGTGIALVPNVGGDFPGHGFPGTQSILPGIGDLLSPATFVFVADVDGDLSTHETFPSGLQIHTTITSSVLSSRGRPPVIEGVAVSTVGPDTDPVELLFDPATLVPMTTPVSGASDVDPLATLELSFTKAVQPFSLGPFDDGTPPVLGSAVLIQFGPPLSRVSVPYSVRPRTIFDFTHMVLRPILPFVAGNPSDAGICTEFSEIQVTVAAQQTLGLGDNQLPNSRMDQFLFSTGEGPGLVNAVVLPDALYVGRNGASPSLSVIDLNGFGAGTGSPVFDDASPIKEGNSNFPNNPNLRVNGSMLVPLLERGICTVDGGSRGVFTLCVDSALDDRLVKSPVIESVADIAIGHSLDNTFNNGLPFGCQSGGGNLCAQSGQLKTIFVAISGGNSFAPPSTIFNTFSFKCVEGGENLMSWGPHPNPPPLIFPPTCFAPLIGGLEPTSVTTVPLNLLTPGASAFGIPSLDEPPRGLLALEQNSFFQGPSPPSQNITSCSSYMLRQQIGQFMYVIDRARAEVVVFNSNRFNVLDRIALPDPTSFATSPNLDFLAVTSQRANQVDFIDIDPGSSNFHEVVASINVGRGPTGIAWTPDNEDILVCNTTDSTMTILSAFNFQPRRTIRNNLRSPLDLAITPRETTFGRFRNVYFAYILNGDGTVAVFESGPNGLNGWGFDDVIQVLPFVFKNARAIQPEPANMESQFWVVHENQLDPGTGQETGLRGGAVSLVRLSSGAVGQQSLGAMGGGGASPRDLGWKVAASIGSDQLTGIPVDIAFDNMVSTGALSNFTNSFSANSSPLLNGKSIMKAGPFNAPTIASAPRFMFLAIPSSSNGIGAIDVIERPTNLRLDTNVFQPGTQSITVPNVTIVADFYRQ